MNIDNDSNMASEKEIRNKKTSKDQLLVTPDKKSSASQVSTAYRNYSHMALEKQGPSTSSFPSKLHRILSSPVFTSIIVWMPHGRSWRLLKPKIFEEEVIPLFFRHSSLSSFMRQVSGWGFRRVNKGTDTGSFYHERFLRGLPHVCTHMRRLGKEQYQFSHAPYPQYAPDFYAISKKYPVPEHDASVSDAISKKDNSPSSVENRIEPQAFNEMKRSSQVPGVIEQDSKIYENRNASKQSFESVTNEDNFSSQDSIETNSLHTTMNTGTLCLNTNLIQNQASVLNPLGRRDRYICTYQYPRLEDGHQSILNNYCSIPQGASIGRNTHNAAMFRQPVDNAIYFSDSAARINAMRMKDLERELVLRHQLANLHEIFDPQHLISGYQSS